ncbi:MAG: aminoacyl-tRNA hydrolase [Actinomycetota bacterium]
MARKSSRTGKSSSGVPMLGTPGPGPGIKLVVGMGNPGRRYRNTRHNAGATAAAELAGRGRIVSRARWDMGELALIAIGERTFLLLLPSTYMNESGRSVAPVARRYRLDPGEVMVLHDDIDIPAGEIRVKKGGGTGGHRGLESLGRELGGTEFCRVRIGVGRPPEGVDAAEYVLARPEEGARSAVGESARRAADAALGLMVGDETVG